MEVDNLRLKDEHVTPKGFKCICTFNLQLTPEVKLYDLQLLRAPDGKYLVYPPKSISGAPMCSISPALRDKIAEIASAAVVGACADNVGEWFNKNYFNHMKKAR